MPIVYPATGPTGPTGPTGATGPTGPAGAAGAIAPLAVVKYDPATVTKSPTTSLTAVDTTNATISFTIPASGKVIVVVTVSIRGSSNTNGDWLGLAMVTHNTTTLITELVNALQQVSNPGSGVQVEPNVSTRFYVTGLTPGAAQWDLAYQTSGTGAAQASLIIGNNGTIHAPLLIEVYSA